MVGPIRTERSRKGPYARVGLIRPGDWLYHVNHSYRNSPHSGIFVRWTNRRRKIARMVSYAGSRRNEPGRYRDYDLSSVYRITRPLDR